MKSFGAAVLGQDKTQKHWYIEIFAIELKLNFLCETRNIMIFKTFLRDDRRIPGREGIAGDRVLCSA